MRRSRRRMSRWWQQYPSNRARRPVTAVSAMGQNQTSRELTFGLSAPSTARELFPIRTSSAGVRTLFDYGAANSVMVQQSSTDRASRTYGLVGKIENGQTPLESREW